MTITDIVGKPPYVIGNSALLLAATQTNKKSLLVDALVCGNICILPIITHYGGTS
jgi:hypothetical protein